MNITIDQDEQSAECEAYRPVVSATNPTGHDYGSVKMELAPAGMRREREAAAAYKAEQGKLWGRDLNRALRFFDVYHAKGQQYILHANGFKQWRNNDQLVRDYRMAKSSGMRAAHGVAIG